jgi:ribonuclease HII
VDKPVTIEIGVDEAGRGPFIGDMVIAGVIGLSSTFESLVSIGLRDSKLLEPLKRLTILNNMLSLDIDIVATYVSPIHIDRSNMNMLEYTVICSILKHLSYSHILRQHQGAGVRIYIDEVKGYNDKIGECARGLYRGNVEIFIESRADAKYPAVSAASIVAKILRDSNIKALQVIAGETGSGYPGDPVSRRWLANTYRDDSEPPVYIRRSWGIVRDLAPSWYVSKQVKHGKKEKSLLDYIRRGVTYGDQPTSGSKG